MAKGVGKKSISLLTGKQFSEIKMERINNVRELFAVSTSVVVNEKTNQYRYDDGVTKIACVEHPK